MKESESSSNSNQWSNRYEAFQVRYESLEDWLKKVYKFDRIAKIAESEGKTLEYVTSITANGTIVTDVICR